MVSFAPLSDETYADRRRYLDEHLAEVACLDCLARVGVKKNSEHHTSIQWNEQALNACPEFSRMSRRPEGRPVHEGCPRLVASIESATREGQIPIGAEDGY